MEASSERLPWLTDKPSTAAGTGVRAMPRDRAMWPWYLLFVLLVAAVAAGAWWLRSGPDNAAPPTLPVEQSVPIVAPATQNDTAASSEVADNATAPEAAAPSPMAPPLVERARPGAPDRGAARESREARPAQRPARGTFPADDPTAVTPLPSDTTPVVLANPRPYSGRVVQLGAFPTRSQADESWRRITRRYPYLATKPKMVNTVDVRGLPGGRPTRMFRLQLGTSSQAQSVVICQQLEKAGQSCVVVY